MRPSLEEERRALLTRIEASRAVYRRMLSGAEDANGQQAAQSSHEVALARKYAGFPRSRTVRWMMDHPLAVAAGISLLVWLAPRWWAAGNRVRSGQGRHHLRSHRQPAEQERGQAYRNMPGEGTGRALLTAAVLLMRNPATMRTLSRAASAAWVWFQQRRSRRSPIRQQENTL